MDNNQMFNHDYNSICQPGITKSLSRQFIHANTFHLASNAISMYQVTQGFLSFLEPGKYAILVLVLIVMNTLTDYVVPHQCSVGFSGVIFSLVGYLYLRQGYFNLTNLAILLLPTFTTPGISIAGHLLGLINGVVLYFLVSFGSRIGNP